MTLVAERTTVPNALTFQSVEENENHRGFDPSGTLKNCSLLTVKSTTSSIIDATLSRETHSESLDLKPMQNGIQLRHQFALKQTFPRKYRQCC